MSRKKKKKNLCTKITIFCFAISVVCIAVWIILFNVNNMLGGKSVASTNAWDAYDFSNDPKKENVSILFAGVDKDGLRTDSIIYAKYDTVNNELYMMSIPRDTYTENPLANIKLNSIYYGGQHTDEFVQEIEDMLDVSVDYYAVIDLKMVAQIVEEIGGLKITLDDEVWKLNKKTKEWYLAFPKGEQVLDGKQVETLVRNRDYNDGDISRGKMQRKVMTALIENLMSAKNLLKVSSITDTILENINTNATVRDAMKYITEIKEVKLNEITSTNMPLEDISYSVNGTSCVLVDEEEARRIIKEDWVYKPPVVENTVDETITEDSLE